MFPCAGSILITLCVVSAQVAGGRTLSQTITTPQYGPCSVVAPGKSTGSWGGEVSCAGFPQKYVVGDGDDSCATLDCLLPNGDYCTPGAPPQEASANPVG